jgi:malate permease and related proteins
VTTPNLWSVYFPLVGWTSLGWLLGRLLPSSTPAQVGKFLFWIGVPISIVGFLRHAQVSWSLWMAPVAAWAAILLGITIAGMVMRYSKTLNRSQAADFSDKRTQGSFLLAAMVGNTGYIGYPVSLALVGSDYFAWALFYDTIGSTLGAYGLGVALASRFGAKTQHGWESLQTMVKNPALASFGVGLMVRDLPLPPIAEITLKTLSWVMLCLSLVLVGMRLSQLSSLRSLKPALLGVGIKMLLVPIVLGTGLWLLGIRGLEHRVILLQMAMPPAFATLVLAEAYELDQELAVTALVVGCVSLLVTLPLWLWLFG